jgi:hypothetical protein
MKKGIIGVIALIALSFSASSCCKTCTHSNSAMFPDTQVCEKNYNSTSDYNTAISVLEANGYTCK